MSTATAAGARFACRNEHRLRALKESEMLGTLNAIEYVEVRDTDEPVTALRQRTLYVRMVRPVPPAGSAGALTPANVSITGGDRIERVEVEWVVRADATGADVPPGVSGPQWSALVADVDEPDHVLVVRTAERGDFSTYVLRVVRAGTEQPPSDFDPRLSEVALRFKVECPTDFDCRDDSSCDDVAEREGPRIDYLAKDFTGFRRIMLERLAQLSPSWSERNPADIGIALVEALAYVADELSWRQDAIATEAYLGTARSRVSLRRHARLVDYRVHEGCNARVWLRVRTSAATSTLPAGSRAFTRVTSTDERVLPPDGDEERAALRERPEVFETLGAPDGGDDELHTDLDALAFHTWGEPGACLPRGATSATLRGDHPLLRPGDVLVLAETADPAGGAAVDADPTHRYPVRLLTVVPGDDPAGGLFEEPPTAAGVPVTEITWHPDDALPEALVLTHAETGSAVAAAWGNIVLAEHGFTAGVDRFTGAAATLSQGQLAFVRPVAHEVSARATVTDGSDPRQALPAVLLSGERVGVTTSWEARSDLLESRPIDPHVVVEVEHDRTARLRFGDGTHGRSPESDTAFTATYRVGSGTAGNVGRDSIHHLASASPAIFEVTNPLPATGGRDPETAHEVRRDAPQAFFTQERAVTPADYAERAERTGVVQRASSTFRWTGSWHTVFVTADRPGGRKVDPDFETDLRGRLEPYRMAGYDLEVDGPVFVPLEVDLLVCAEPDHLRSDIAAAARDALSATVGPDGTPGLFHPDRLTFGQPVHLSSVVARLHTIEGVESVTVTTFQRLGQPATSGLDDGVLPMQRLEIARLDNDPSFPERGVLRIRTGGGR